MAQAFVVRVERFVRLTLVSAVVNALLLAVSVLGLAPRVFGPPEAMPVWNLILTLAVLFIGAGVLWLLRRRN